MSVVNCGDCLTELPKLESNSIDLMVTDPPYGYSFMGKDWDKAVVSVDIWKECLRVLKPGAFAFIMSSPRQDVLSEMIRNLRLAGFETNFTSLYWCYLNGFPKAQNISKMADKKRVGDKFWEVRSYLRDCVKKGGLTHRQMNIYLGHPPDSNIWSHWIGLNNDQESVPNWKDWKKLKEILPLDDRYDHLILEAEREVLESRRRTPASQSNTSHEYGFGEKTDGWFNITKPTTPQAKALNGSYTGYNPKPSVEVILVVQKPLEEKTYVDQALTNRKGITWLDDCKTNNRFPANLVVEDNALGEKVSPFFSLDSWAKSKLPFLVVPKPSKSEKGDYNTHVSVKPVKLMSYLITMGSRPNDIILDPFAGSGTTGIAALQLGRRFIGIEMSQEYCEIAQKRLEPYIAQTKLSTY